MGTLKEAWTHQFGTGNVSAINGSVAESNGVVYALSAAALPTYGGGTLAAFSATSCPSAPTSCAPLWVSPAYYNNGEMNQTPLVANGEIYLENGNNFGLAYSTDYSSCPSVSGTPLCLPLRVYDEATNPAGLGGASLVDNGVLYTPGGATYSADGSENCTGVTTYAGTHIPLCEPIRSYVPPSGLSLLNGSPTVATAADGKSILYLEGHTKSGVLHVFAYDATGSQGCSTSGATTICTPLWTYEAPGSLGGGAAVSVANGFAYVGGANNVGSGQGTLFAFDQNGVTNCSAQVCSPVLETSGGPSFPSLVSNLAVTASSVFATTGTGTVAAFSATGCGQTNCTGALWSTGVICANNGVRGGASTANGVVYVGIENCSNTGWVAAFSTSGAGLWLAASPDKGGISDPPTIANGVVYFGSSNGSVYAYALP